MLKADLDGTIFAYDCRARLAYVMTSRQIVSRAEKCRIFPLVSEGFSPGNSCSRRTKKGMDTKYYRLYCEVCDTAGFHLGFPSYDITSKRTTLLT